MEVQPLRRNVSAQEIREIRLAHEKWLASEHKDGRMADFAACDLMRINDLAGADLRQANFTAANLQDASLHKAHLRDATFVGANLLGTILSDTDLNGANFATAVMVKADLSRVNLQFSRLSNIDMHEANLSGADLRDARLDGVKLQGAQLRDADFRGATLEGAFLNGANMLRTNLREANLRDANLTAVEGLSSEQLGGANVSGAKLPDAILRFEGLSHVEKASVNARKLHVATLLGCVYTLLTVATTTDTRLLTNSTSSPLPIIGASIPIAAFYAAAPIILVAMYLYLHLHLQRLWDSLADLPAVFPDGRRLDKTAYPWLLNGLVLASFKQLQQNRPPFSRLQKWMTIMLAWSIVPVTLFFVWARYLPRHDWYGTCLHIGLLVISIAGWVVFQRHAFATLRAEHWTLLRWGRKWTDWRFDWCLVFPVIVGLLLVVFSTGAIEGAPTDIVGARNPSSRTTATTYLFQRWAQSIFVRIGYIPFADLQEADISTKPPNWTGSIEKAKEEIPLVKGAKLRNTNLTYANAYHAFLVKADLRGSRLGGANLTEADLRDANLQGADCSRAFLKGANLEGVEGFHADLHESDLQGAVLWKAQLQEVNFERANLSSARLDTANLEKATLTDTNLQGSVLRGVTLVEANLQGADLRGAQLVQVNLHGAQLGSAKLDGAQLGGSDLTETDLEGADLKGTNLFFADLQRAKGLTLFKLSQARNWRQAYYSEDALQRLGLPPDHNKRVGRAFAEFMKKSPAEQYKAGGAGIVLQPLRTFAGP